MARLSTDGATRCHIAMHTSMRCTVREGVCQGARRVPVHARAAVAPCALVLADAHPLSAAGPFAVQAVEGAAIIPHWVALAAEG
eukprot:SAG11_NODE_33264_length_278_cov_0.854749_1_plen_83_part_01